MRFGPPTPLCSLMLLGCGPSGSGSGFTGPLDSHETDLVAAFLPFRGFASYAGPGLRIRDDGDGDAEQDIAFAGDGELDLPVFLGNAAVRCWYDQSSNGLDMTQATAADQPYLLASSINSKPAVDFDGTSDYLDNGGSLSFAAGCSLYFVLCADVDGAWQSLWCTSSGTATRLRKRADTNQLQVTYGAVNANSSSSMGTTPKLIAFTLSGSAGKAWVNNTSEIDTTGGTATAGAYRLGIQGDGNFPLNGKIAAVLAYNATHDDTTRQAIQTILANYFGITLA